MSNKKQFADMLAADPHVQDIVAAMARAYAVAFTSRVSRRIDASRRRKRAPDDAFRQGFRRAACAGARVAMMRELLAAYMFKQYAQRDRMRFAEEPSDRSEPLEPLKLAPEELAESEPEPS